MSLTGINRFAKTLQSREKGFSLYVRNKKTIKNGLDIPAEQMTSYSWLRGRNIKLVPSVVLLPSLEKKDGLAGDQHGPGGKLMKRLSVNSVLPEIHLGPCGRNC